MNATVRRLALTMVLAFLAALAGVWVGCRLMTTRMQHGTEVHALLHHEVALDRQQEAALDVLEARFGVRRRALEAQMRADNAQLAAAIEREHDNGPAVAAAVDQSHRTMGALQKATLEHVFAMRRLLRPDQTAAFDRIVMRALTPAS